MTTTLDLIERWAQRTPNAPAVECGGETITYAQLVEQASRIGAALRELGAAPETIVGLSVTRSTSMIAALLGVWKSGAAYLPLDPDYPEARLHMLVEDARPLVVLCDDMQTPRFDARRVPTLTIARALKAHEAAPAAAASAGADDRLAYVIHTSGSTGKPKGVMVDHAALLERTLEQLRAFDVTPQDRVSQYASTNFDMSVFEITLGLCTGATLCVGRPHAALPGPALARHLEEQRISVATFPPSVLAALPDAPLPRLRLVFLGGEAVTRSIVERFGAHRRLVNVYGPTETTVWVTTAFLSRDADITIGSPVTGVRAHVLDAEGRELPPGARGELCIGGAGLARGYLHAPDLTAQRFVPDPFDDAPGARLYRTGDLASLRADGLIEYHGRIDRQVKVRGMRIEPGEVEAALAALPEIRDAAVLAEPGPGGDHRLVAYVVPRAQPPERARRAHEDLSSSLREKLRARLVKAMVPAIFVEMPSFPLTPNGKLDRAALPPAAGLAPASRASGADAPQGPMEIAIERAWAHALQLDGLGAHENVFDLGAHSLLVAQVQARLEEQLAREVPVVALFEHPTVARLARHLAPPPAQADAPAQRVDVARGRALARAQARGRGRAATPTEADPDV